MTHKKKKKKKKKKWNTAVYTAICGSVLHCVSKKCTNLVRNFKDLFIFGVRFERRKVDKKQTYMKTETCKLYYTSFVISAICRQIDPYNIGLYCFNDSAFLRHSVDTDC